VRIVERVIALHRVPIFSTVPGRVLAAVAVAAGEAELAPGTTFVHEGAVEDHLWVVVSGAVRVHRGELVIRDLGPGDTVGELAALSPEPRSASVSTTARTALIRIDKPILDELLADYPELMQAVVSVLVDRVRDLTPQAPALSPGRA